MTLYLGVVYDRSRVGGEVVSQLGGHLGQQLDLAARHAAYQQQGGSTVQYSTVQYSTYQQQGGRLHQQVAEPPVLLQRDHTVSRRIIRTRLSYSQQSVKSSIVSCRCIY